MMHRNDYQMIADEFARQFSALDTRDPEYLVRYEALVKLRDGMIEAFKKQNPAFDEFRFVEACHEYMPPVSTEPDEPVKLTILAEELRVGDVLLLPFEKTATIESVKNGRLYTSYKTEHGTARVFCNAELLIERKGN